MESDGTPPAYFWHQPKRKDQGLYTIKLSKLISTPPSSNAPVTSPASPVEKSASFVSASGLPLTLPFKVSPTQSKRRWLVPSPCRMELLNAIISCPSRVAMPFL